MPKEENDIEYSADQIFTFVLGSALIPLCSVNISSNGFIRASFLAE